MMPSKVRLRIISDGEKYYFFYARPDDAFDSMGTLECSLVSTEVVGGFTGVTIGMFTESTAEEGFAEFNYFDYQEK